MKKIFLSLATIAAVAALAIGASRAFFSDVETSTGNILQAGAIDLLIDNESYVIDYLTDANDPTGQLVLSDATTWLDPKNLDEGDLFFNFTDIKPGDWGEDTISIHVNNNDAYVCAMLALTEDSDVDYTEPELEVDPTVAEGDALGTDGELPENISFFWWPDDGDNVLEEDEVAILPPNMRDQDGPMGRPLSELLAESEDGVVTLADSVYNFFTGAYNPNGGVSPVEGGATQYLGKAWCLGEMTFQPAADPNGVVDTSPLVRQTIFCNGEQVDNASQTDRLEGMLSFYAVQARSNEDFVCSADVFPDVNGDNDQTQTLRLENKEGSEWTVIEDDGVFGILTWAGDGPTFDFSASLVAEGLEADTNYSLIYYADPWPGNHPGALLGTGQSDANGDLTIQNEVDLGFDLPHPDDANDTGAKIWLIPSEAYDEGSKSVMLWPADPSEPPAGWLFETELIQYEDTDV